MRARCKRLRQDKKGLQDNTVHHGTHYRMERTGKDGLGLNKLKQNSACFHLSVISTGSAETSGTFGNSNRRQLSQHGTFWPVVCVHRLCGLGNEPGEAVEHRLKHRWINHFSLAAGE